MSAVLDEHYDYLSLKGRHELYRQAIAKVIQPGDVVADLGCGFGVLGLQCLAAGAARAYGIDASDAIHIARETADRAGVGSRYLTISGSSYRASLPEPADLVICDHVGWFGFDYDIIPMLADARRRLLRPGGAIMPRRLQLQVAAVASPGCADLLERWSREPVPPQFAWLGEYEANAKHPRDFAPDDLCSAPAVLGTVDLAADGPDGFAFATTLVAGRAGQCNGIAGWFACELAEDVWMTNSPLDPGRIGRNQVFLAARTPFAVAAGDAIGFALRFAPAGDLIGWTITPPGGQPRQKLSTFNSLPLPPQTLGGGPPQLGPVGRARLALLEMVDGQADHASIEAAFLARFPALFPDEAEIRRFVQDELRRACG